VSDFNMPPGVRASDIPGQDEPRCGGWYIRDREFERFMRWQCPKREQCALWARDPGLDVWANALCGPDFECFEEKS
jgi:hypothetical protein